MPSCVRAGLSSQWDRAPGSGSEKEFFRCFGVGNHLSLGNCGVRDMTGAADMSRSESDSRDQITEAGHPVGACAAPRPASVRRVALLAAEQGYVVGRRKKFEGP